MRRNLPIVLLLILLVAACASAPRVRGEREKRADKSLVAGRTWSAKRCYDRAEIHLLAALKYGFAIDSVPHLVQAYHELGHIELNRGHVPQAGAYYELARLNAEQAGLSSLQARSIRFLAEVDRRANRPGSAGLRLARALELARTADDRYEEAAIRNSQGLLHRMLEQEELAATAFGDALNINRELGSSRAAANLLNLGRLHADRGELASAKSSLREALEIDRAAEHTGGIAADLMQLARVARMQGEWKAALTYELRALGALEYLADGERIAESVERLIGDARRANRPSLRGAFVDYRDHLMNHPVRPDCPAEAPRE